MKPECKKILQIGMLVRDVDKCVKYYEEFFGMGPWEVSIMDGSKVPGGLTMNGEPCEGPFAKFAFLHAYGMEIELIEPIAASTTKDWVDEHGSGLHHLAFMTEDSYDDLLANYKEMTGRDPWARGIGMGGRMDYSYLDLREELGFFFECYRNIMPGRAGLDYDFKLSEDYAKVEGAVEHPELKKLLQIGMLVRDVDKCVKFYEEKYGMGPWEVSIMDGSKMPGGLTMNGVPIEGQFAKFAFLHAFGVEIELIEPIADSPLKKWVDERGSGLHHLAFQTDSTYPELLAKGKEINGKDTWARGVGAGGRMDFSYIDLREELGFFLECYGMVAPGRAGAPFDLKTAEPRKQEYGKKA